MNIFNGMQLNNQLSRWHNVFTSNCSIQIILILSVLFFILNSLSLFN